MEIRVYGGSTTMNNEIHAACQIPAYLCSLLHHLLDIGSKTKIKPQDFEKKRDNRRKREKNEIKSAYL